MSTYSAELISFCTLPSLTCLEGSPSLARLLSVALYHSSFTSSTHLILPHLLTLAHTTLLPETDSSGLFPLYGLLGLLCCHLNIVGCHTQTYIDAHLLIHTYTDLLLSMDHRPLVRSQLCGGR